MGDLNEMTYPDMLNRFRERRDESTVLLPLMSQAGKSVETLKNVKTCLSVGPGPGEYDLEFAKRCLPALQKIVAVEKDHFCAEEFKQNIDKLYAGSLKREVFEINIEEYTPTDKVDVVLMFHMLYGLGIENILRSALENWINPENGMLVIINMSDDLDESKQKINVLQKLQLHFNGEKKLLTVADDIKEDIKKVGGKVTWSQKYRCSMDFRVFDDDIAHILNLSSDHVITNDAVKEALTKLVPDGIGTYIGEILVVSRA